MNVKNTACDMLLQHRVERKLRSKRAGDVINRISITQPVRRDNKVITLLNACYSFLACNQTKPSYPIFNPTTLLTYCNTLVTLL
jgi:hypothetical protein